ncbi:universal stress protein [Actinoplanes sp. NPDC048967]|uniref:universal stress protein n=1 Tax=Actinoplanes sp. NPDC048967 TaxID=3155269 RepID=UPI0033E2D17E
MSRDEPGPAGPAGPVLIGIHGIVTADEALRCAFAEADRRGVPLTVVLTGATPWPDSVDQSELVRLWAEKYPEVPVTTTIRRGLDPAVVIAASSHGCGLLVVQRPADPAAAAVVDALSRRAHCPVVVVGEAALPTGAAA